LAGDAKARTDFLAKAFFDVRIFFNSVLWTLNAQAEHGFHNIPFILWKHQEPAVLRLKNAIENKEGLLFDKSRNQGATYIILGVFLLYWLISPGSKFLLGSRKEALVDDGCEIENGTLIGSEESLFYKLLYMINTLPLYLQPNLSKKKLFLQNLDSDTVCRGDTTNIGFGKGFRTTANLVDETAQIEPKIALWLIENLADTAFCNIFNSTVGPWGGTHPYSKLMKENEDKVIVLDWTDNPIQNQGLYISRKPGEIEIFDIDYYRKKYPGKFDTILPNTVIPVEEVANIYPFVADGGIEYWGCKRSVWFDADVKRTERTKRGIAQNILRIDTGSTDSFFDYELTKKLRDDFVKQPTYRGEIKYQREPNDELSNIHFEPGGVKSSFVWWGDIKNKRPNQLHNYVVGCDISKGTGTSNSVAAVYDVNTNEIVGLFVNPYLKISDFAEQVVAICDWVGGTQQPFLIWEANGAPEFVERIQELGHYSLYIKQDEKARVQRKGNRYGWWSTGGRDGTKIDVLSGLHAALHEGLREKPRFTPCKIYDEQLVNELDGYVFYEGRVEVGPNALQTETSGAKAAHGDRVIAVALCVLGAKSQPKSELKHSTFTPPGSFMARFERENNKIENAKRQGKQWLY